MLPLSYAMRKLASDILGLLLIGAAKMDEDNRHRSKIVLLRRLRRAPGQLWRAPLGLVALLAVAIVVVAYPWPVQSKQQDPGRATITRAEGVLQT